MDGIMITNGHAFDERAVYKIWVLGMLDPTWSDWFDGFTIKCLEGETLLIGPVEDQAALLGILTKITGLGLTLLSVERNKGVDP